ncbi:MAG: PKD domain-containing protein [Nitrospirae bacterium]|nr:PKD domain-containing protein [Nitrospirota bacterium]
MAIAIDPQLHIAVVIHNTWGKGDDEKDKDKKNRDNITIIDLNTLSITKTLQAGKNPINVAINPLTHEAAVANEKSDDITVIDLNVLAVKGTIPIGKHPKALSYNECLNTLSVVGGEDKAWMKLIEETGTLKASYTFNDELKDIKIHSYLNRTVAAGEEGLRIVNLPNPPPRLLSITPESALRGGKSVRVTLTGKGLLEPTETYLNGNRVNSTFLTCGNIKADIPDSYLTRAGYIEIRAVNPAPEGGASNTITLTVNNPMPSITALEPAEVFAGTQSLVLNISGTGFFDDTEVYFGGLKKQETFINTTKLQVELTAQELNTPGKYELMTYNSPPGGGNSNKVIFTVKNPLEIKITSPTDGETINKAKIIVKGIFKSDIRDIGITVNGMIAEIRGNEWIVNDVPLAVGTNAITVTIKDSSGNSASSAITINTTDITQPVTLSANITSGISPLTVFFSTLTSTFTPILYQMDFEGDGVIDYTGQTFESISHTYTTEGIFYPTITVTDDQGNTYSDTIAITVLNKAEVDTLLKGKWEGMKGALAVGDINRAVINFDSASQV